MPSTIDFRPGRAAPSTGGIGQAGAADQEAGNGRPDDCTDLEQHLEKRKRGDQVRLSDQERDDRVPGRVRKAGQARCHGADHVERPESGVCGHRVQSQYAAREHQRDTRNHEEGASIHGVAHRAADQRPHHQRDELGQADRANLERRMRLCVHLERDGDDRELRADRRDELAEEQQVEVVALA